MKHISFVAVAFSLAFAVSGCQISGSEEPVEIENAVMRNDEFGFAFVTTPECLPVFDVRLWQETVTYQGDKYVTYDVTQVCGGAFSDGGIYVTTKADAADWPSNVRRQAFFVDDNYVVLYYPPDCASQCELSAVVY